MSDNNRIDSLDQADASSADNSRKRRRRAASVAGSQPNVTANDTEPARKRRDNLLFSFDDCTIIDSALASLTSPVFGRDRTEFLNDLLRTINHERDALITKQQLYKKVESIITDKRKQLKADDTPEGWFPM